MVFATRYCRVTSPRPKGRTRITKAAAMQQINPAKIIASLIAREREDEALQMFDALGIDTPEGYMSVLNLLSERGDDFRLHKLASRGASQFPAHAEIHAHYVNALLREGDPASAAKTAEAFMHSSGNQGLWALWAESLLRAYEFERAGTVLNQYMPQNPFNAGAWIVTARLLWLHPIPETRNVLSGLIQEIKESPIEYGIDQGHMCFAAGLIHEALGDLDAAWDAFNKGNEIHHAVEMAEKDEEGRLAQSIQHHISAEWIKDNSLEIGRSPRPIFALGSPVSGIAELYTAATADQSMGRVGEPRMFERDLHRLCGPSHEEGYGEALSRLTKDDLSSLRQRYLEVNRERIAGASSFVDGLGANIRHAGVLKAMFPDAIFLRATTERHQEAVDLFRLPLDPRAHRSASDMEAIQGYLAAHDQLSAHWSNIMGYDFAPVEGPKRKAVEAHVPGWRATGQGGSLSSAAFDWPAPRGSVRKRYMELAGLSA